VSALQLALQITWDATEGAINIRGILVVLVGFVVLVGSVYLLLATNTGPRLGFLIAAGAFWGWMSMMGLQWWLYGIGYVGPTGNWHVTEVVTSDTPDDLSAAALSEAHDLSTWKELPADDPKRGEAQAAADEALTGEESPFQAFEATTDYIPIDAFEQGGKGTSLLERRLPGGHPPHHALIQVQGTLPVVALEPGQTCPFEDEANQCYAFGTTPPALQADPEQPVKTVVLVRNLGNKRLPPALITLTSLLLFGLTCNALHRRDKLAQQNRALVPTAGP